MHREKKNIEKLNRSATQKSRCERSEGEGEGHEAATNPPPAHPFFKGVTKKCKII